MKYSMLLPLMAVAACSAQPPPTAKVMPAPVVEFWARQDVVSNVQDWDRMATKIVGGLQTIGLVGPGSVPPGHLTITCNRQLCDHASTFLVELSNAVQNEIIRRGSYAGDMQIALSVDVVAWGSRSTLDPNALRREGVMQAVVVANGRTMSFREPFYIFDADVGLYAQLPPPAPAPLTPTDVLKLSQKPIVFSTTR